jgi:hypothetical protein
VDDALVHAEVMKACSRCRIEKPLTDFHRSKNRPDGRHPQCKDCRCVLGREERAANSLSRAAARRLLAEGKKRCSVCGEVKDIGEFYRKTGSLADGHKSDCKTCYNARSVVYRATPEGKALAKAALERRRTEDPGAFRRQRRAVMFRRRYGIELEDYEALLEQQEGRCAICARFPLPDVPLNLDHDHATGKPRGLLCRRCNTGLGMFDDDTAALYAAIRYLSDGLRGPAVWTTLWTTVR